tara:strand:+ start:1082 stop:8320 length:7239 start_codon:yes stop_codon:yes gene_type:complete
MAESKFLKYQDIDRDGVIDVCDDDLTTPELPCKGPCTPDPTSIIPDWKKQDIFTPFLNTKICHFQITKVTPYSSTSNLQTILAAESSDGVVDSTPDDELEAKFEEFKQEAIENMLDYCPIGARLKTEQTIAIVSKAMQFKKFDLDARPNSRLKLLYSVPFDIIYDLADAVEPGEEVEEEEGPGWEKISFNAENLMFESIRVRKGLHFYSKLLKVSSGIGEGDAYFVNSEGKATHRFDLQGIGDPAIFSRGQLSDMIDQLKGFLNSKGMALPSGGIAEIFSGLFKEKVTKLQFSFKDKRLRVVRAWTEGCGDKPAVYTAKKSLKVLVGDGKSKRYDWNNETLVNYFMRLSEMARQLNSRVELPWRDFLETYTFPQIKITKFPTEETLGSCLYNNLRDSINEIGTDVLDELFGLGDLVAYLYNDTLCRDKLKEILEDDEELNRVAPQNPDSPFGREVAAILAKNQRWAKLSADDDVVLRICTNAFAPIANGAGGLASTVSGGLVPNSNVGNFPAGPMGQMQPLFEEGLQSLKLCGLLDLIFDSLGCLMGGLSFDDALPIIIKKALEAMGIEQFGQLFVGLPPEKQAEMDELVEKELAKQGKGGPTTPNMLRPWADPEVISAERVKTNPSNMNNYESVLPPTYGETMSELAGSDRTILSSLDRVGTANNAAGIDLIMQAYVVALLEVFEDNLIVILDELNNFPGAPLVRDILSMTALSCPKPPLFNPGIDDFIKSLGLAFCRTPREVTIPVLNQALEFKMAFKDILYPLWVVARFLAGMIIVIVVNQIIAKVCEILVRAVCKALETAGDIVLGLPDMLAGNTTLMDILRDNICGEDADQETLENTVVDMMSIIGLGPAAFTDRDKTISFANDLSLSVTRQEFSDALLGNPSEQFLEAADQLIEFVYTDFRDAMPNKKSIARFTKGIGNFLPLEYREVLKNYSLNNLGVDDGMPANPSVCSTPEQLQRFQELRHEILGGRASKSQIDQLYCDLRDDNLDDLETLTEILNTGIGNYVANKIPNTLSTPGCDDGLLPYEAPQTVDAAIGFMGAALDGLENEYLDDMMGTGFTFFGMGDSNFGFLNMILCDTRGNPLTNHHRKSSNRKGYVDFATNVANGGETSRGFFSFLQGNAAFDEQEGQLPYFVGEWMKRQFLNAGGVTGFLEPGYNLIEAGGQHLSDNLIFRSGNKPVKRTVYRVDVTEMEYSTNILGNQGTSTIALPDFGYNTIVGKVIENGPDILSDDDEIEIIRLPRKGDPNYPGGKGKPKSAFDKSGADIALDFRDNSMGTYQGMDFGSNWSVKTFPWAGNTWSYGFEVQCFYSDIEEHPDTKAIRNRPDDNIRVSIIEKVNYGADRRFASPIAKQLTAEDMKLPPFDLPNWIENIPLVGFAIENLMALIMLPFSTLMSKLLAMLKYLFSDDVKRFRKFEFLAVDDGLDAFAMDKDVDENKEKALDINKFPHYLSTRRGLKPYAPQIYALADLLGTSPNSAMKESYDSTMEGFYKDFCKMIGENEYGWRTGAVHDLVTPGMFEYGVLGPDGEFVPYDAISRTTFIGEILGFDDEEMQLGMTYDQYVNGENARVIVLDPTVYGGTFNNPPLFVKPNNYMGWWGITQALFPGDTACKPHGKNLIDFDEIKEMLQQYYPSLEEDTRLYSDTECERQVPFDRILPRYAKIQMYTLILAAIRIYASTHIMKAIGTFSTVQPKFPDNYSTIYSAYLAERMEDDFKNAQPAFWEFFSPFKDDEFWYAFLEQSVECYDFLVNAGAIETPVKGGYIQSSSQAINNLQTHYRFTYRTKDTRKYRDEKGNKRTQTVPGLWEQRFTGDAGFFESLGSFRERKNFEGIQEVEDEAKIFLQELINHELTKMGEKFVGAMEKSGFQAKIYDLDYWLFENKCVDSNIKYRSDKIVEEPVGVPSRANPDPQGTGATFPGPYYTPGNQFRVAIDKNENDGASYSEEYIGYYHIHIDEEGDEVYMAGAVHGPDPHDVIVPVGDIVKVTTVETVIENSDNLTVESDAPHAGDRGGRPVAMGAAPVITKQNVGIGDFPHYGSGGSYTDERPFKIEKYTSINGTRYNDEEAKSIIHAQPGSSFLSDIYPGTLRMIENKYGVEVGIEGNIGVRHGLVFYYQGTEITSVEVDALDYTTAQFQTVQPNSKLLHCLVQNLKHDPKYKLFTSYIFSMKKVLGTLAIYNDFGFLASVGEVTPGTGDNNPRLLVTDNAASGIVGKLLAGLGLPIVSQRDRSKWMGSNMAGANPPHAVRTKPGSRAYIDQSKEEIRVPMTQEIRDAYGLPFWYDDDIVFENVQQNAAGSFVTGNEGWEHPKDRPSFTPFTLNWDEWDRELLRNCRSRIKSMFRPLYYAAQDRPGKKRGGRSPSLIKLRNLKARLFPAPGAGILPWWQRRRLKSNPYNANGEMCDGPDLLG